jgi:hypothetical protein
MPGARASGREVARLLEQIRALTTELRELERHARGDARRVELRRGLETLRGRLAEAARVAAAGE